MKLYPLKFKPIYKERVWGGDRLLKTETGNPIGEKWALSAVKGDLSVVNNGFLKGNNIQEIIEIYMGDLVGDSVYSKFGVELPLLFKIIDTADKLSVQVHPNDDISLKRHEAYGKTEMWYVLDCKPHSKICVGFNKPVTREDYVARVKAKTLNEILNDESTAIGDVFFLPAGRIHAIGKDLLIAEIQQTSDITYRIYDWGRENNPATAREMHTELAEDVITYEYHDSYKTKYQHKINAPVELVSCNYFTTNLLKINSKIDRDYSALDSFVVYMCVKGTAKIECDNGTGDTITAGDTVMIPAEITSLIISPENEVELLEVYVK